MSLSELYKQNSFHFKTIDFQDQTIDVKLLNQQDAELVQKLISEQDFKEMISLCIYEDGKSLKELGVIDEVFENMPNVVTKNLINAILSANGADLSLDEKKKRLKEDPIERFWIELSYRYGIPRPILKETLPVCEFYDLMAEESLSPRGEEREDFRSAIVALTVARGFGNKKAKLSDFKPKFGKEEQSKDQIMSGFKMIHGVIQENKKGQRMATTAVLNLGLNSSQFNKGIAQSSSKLASFGKLAVGGFALAGGTIVAGLGIVSASLIKTAADAEETSNKFNAVFSNLQTTANETSKELAAGFGLSSNEAQKLLGSTGDLLTGFGFTQASALDLSNQVQELAADLTSFQNFQGGVEGASQSLTKALLGETESLKSLGIVVRQNTDEFRDNVKRIQETTGVTEQQARTQEIFRQITIQSKNAIGDYARTSKSLTNQLKLTGKIWEDLTISVGSFLKELFGAEGILLAFNENFRSLTDNVSGFLSNWRENWTITVDWFRRNAATLFLSDLPRLVGTFTENAIKNYVQFAQIGGKVFILLGDDIIKSMSNVFLVEFPKLLAKSFDAFANWAKSVGDSVKGIMSGEFDILTDIITNKLAKGIGNLTGPGKSLPEQIAETLADGFKKAQFSDLLEGFEFESEQIEFNLELNEKFKKDIDDVKKSLTTEGALVSSDPTERKSSLAGAFEEGTVDAYSAEQRSNGNKTERQIEKYTKQTAQNTAGGQVKVNQVSF